MIRHIFIANRGEIACRIISTCHRLGLKVSVPFIREERNSQFVQMADEAIAFEKTAAQDTYLDIERIIQMAKQLGADAIHPGYGFLSENPDMANACEQAGIVFIGPRAESILWMASKSNAKLGLKQQSVPTIPGYEGDNQSNEFLKEQADKIGYPILIKASMGGGGKGMRCVHSSNTFVEDLGAVKREAMASFGSDHVIIEKYIANARHIEVQLLADQHGGVVHVFERECTIQRRYQKVVEESPSTIEDKDVLTRMYQVAVSIARYIRYLGAGTVEFIYDTDTADFYFLEMNTRLQVEHPVTEAITDIDLVEWQIRIADGERLPKQEEITRSGYAMELRLYGEDPTRSFMPCTGPVHKVVYPTVEGSRIDSFLVDGDTVNPYFDPMLAKVIVHGRSRQAAFQKMQYLLDRFIFFGPKNNLAFLQYLIADQQVQAGNYTTHFLNEFNMEGMEKSLSDIDLIATLLIDIHQKKSTVPQRLQYYRNNPYQSIQSTYQVQDQLYCIEFDQLSTLFECRVNNKTYTVHSVIWANGTCSFCVGDRNYCYSFLKNDQDIYIHHPQSGNKHIQKQQRFQIDDQKDLDGAYVSSLPGSIAAVFVKEGDVVKKGDRLVSTISMKMEHVTEAHSDGIIQQICVHEGDNITADQLLLVVVEEG